MNGAGANANLSGDFQNALAGPQLSLDSFFQRLIDLRAAELLALFYGPPKPRTDSLPDHAAFEFGKRAADLKHQLAGRRSGVDRLPVEVQIDAASL